MKKIIVPTDFSSNASNALHYAYQLASQMDGAIHLVHIFYPTPTSINEYTDIDAELEEIRRNHLAEYAQKKKQQLADLYGTTVPIKEEFILGFPGEKLIELSQTTENAMIVMGSTGETGAMKQIFGSVSTRVAKESKCPVLIVPPNIDYRPISHIAYCTDSIAVDAITTHKVVDFVKPFDAFIHLIHVGENEPIEEAVLVNLWKNHYPESKIKYDQIWGENAIESINQYSAENAIDVVIVSTEERGFFNSMFHRSFTKRMAINTQLPLLITHAKVVYSA